MKPRIQQKVKRVAGRRPAYDAGTLTLAITVRFDEGQASALQAWCVARKISPTTLVREVALIRVGAAELGNGIVEGSATREVRIGACSIPIKLNREQHAAVVSHCRAQGVAPGVFLREATLDHVGAAHLGASSQIDALRRVVGSAGAV
jgi:hypothetical protein